MLVLHYSDHAGDIALRIDDVNYQYFYVSESSHPDHRSFKTEIQLKEGQKINFYINTLRSGTPYYYNNSFLEGKLVRKN